MFFLITNFLYNSIEKLNCDCERAFSHTPVAIFKIYLMITPIEPVRKIFHPTDEKIYQFVYFSADLDID